MKNFKVSFVFETLAPGTLASHNLKLGKCKIDPEQLAALDPDKQIQVIMHEAGHAYCNMRHQNG